MHKVPPDLKTMQKKKHKCSHVQISSGPKGSLSGTHSRMIPSLAREASIRSSWCPVKARCVTHSKCPFMVCEHVQMSSSSRSCSPRHMSACSLKLDQRMQHSRTKHEENELKYAFSHRILFPKFDGAVLRARRKDWKVGVEVDILHLLPMSKQSALLTNPGFHYLFLF